MRNPFINAVVYKLAQTPWGRGGVGHRAATVAQLRAGAKKILDQKYAEEAREAKATA